MSTFMREARRLVKRRKEDGILGAEVRVMVFEDRERSWEARTQAVPQS